MSAQKWTFNTFFPTDSNFICRVVEESFSPSKSSGNPMITLKTEIVAPEEYEIGGEMFTLAGVNPNPLYFTTQAFNDGELDVEKTEKNRKRLEDLYSKFQMDFSKFNPENPELGFKGKLFYCQMSGEENVRRKTPTAEQMKVGDPNAKPLPRKAGEGDVMVNPMSGKPLLSYRPIIREIFGLAPADPNKPY